MHSVKPLKLKCNFSRTERKSQRWRPPYRADIRLALFNSAEKKIEFLQFDSKAQHFYRVHSTVRA